MRGKLLAAMSFAAVLVAGSAALAQDASHTYYISVRTGGSDTPPVFITLSVSQTETQPASIDACDGHTYFVSADDLSLINTTLAARNTVQLYRGAVGGSPEDAAIRCLLQPGQ